MYQPSELAFPELWQKKNLSHCSNSTFKLLLLRKLSSGTVLRFGSFSGMTQLQLLLAFGFSFQREPTSPNRFRCSTLWVTFLLRPTTLTIRNNWKSNLPFAWRQCNLPTCTHLGMHLMQMFTWQMKFQRLNTMKAVLLKSPPLYDIFPHFCLEITHYPNYISRNSFSVLIVGVLLKNCSEQVMNICEGGDEIWRWCQTNFGLK